MSAACFIAVAVFVVILVVIIHATAVFFPRTKLGDVLMRRKFLSSQCSIAITFWLAIRVALADIMSRYECLERQLFDILNGCKVAPLHKNLDYLEEFKALAGKFSNCVKKICKNPMSTTHQRMHERSPLFLYSDRKDFKANQIIVKYMF
uniref:Uncharacterized protein n=1 Tax=Glossina austeni TaxID=7395 RepID=A0A1A9VRZ3_GLOAU